VSPHQTIAALDLGSTSLRYVAGQRDGTFLTGVRTEPTRPGDLETQVVEAVADLDAEPGGVDAVSVSTTGLVDADAGRIDSFDAADGSTVRDVDLRGALSRAFDVPTYLDNDCNVSVLGERVFGDGRDHEAVVHVTMATGIGAGVFLHGTLVRGDNGQAGEVGHLPVGGPDCATSMGVSDSWEAYCSGRGIPQFVAELLADEHRETSLPDPSRITAKALFEEAAAGDPVASDYLERVHRLNAAGIGGVVNAYDPGLLTVGGAVALRNPGAVLSGIEAHLDEFVFGARPTIELTPLGENVELYGALAYPTYESPGRAVPDPPVGAPLDADGGRPDPA
jgi:glucokinase